MRNNLAKFTLTALAAFAISACGSSGGGSDDNNSTPVNDQAQNQTQNQAQQPTTPSTNNQTQQPSQPQVQVTGGTGSALVVSDSDNNVNVRKVVLNTYSPTSINVEGKEITIGYNGISSYNWSNFRIGSTNTDTYVCCGRYSDMRFGVVASLTGNSSDYYFYNGNPTNNMPTSGSATYTGQSIISADVDALPNNFHTGSSQFNVDFGNKTLNGSLGIDGIQAVNVNANISGNSFAGTANSDSLPSQARVEGKFYGTNAKELAGLAQSNDNSWGAAFGAQKQ